jgi:F-type H+-transporting ATPase subunit gamma
METLESIRRRIRNGEDLHAIVKTMKIMAAVSIRQYERAVESLTEYNRTTELGLRVALSGWAQNQNNEKKIKNGSLGVIVFGTDQGMCGQFNDQIVLFALEQLDQIGIAPDRRVVVSVGVRAASRLGDAGQHVDDIYTLPGSASGITPLVQHLLLLVDRWRVERGIEQVYLYYNRPVRGIAYRPTTLQLLPISVEQLSREGTNTWPARSLPTFTMDRERLLTALIRQHLFVILFRTFAESLVSENASRLITMQTAEKNIEERLAEFYNVYHELRQNTITSEILDIISGLEALSED